MTDSYLAKLPGIRDIVDDTEGGAVVMPRSSALIIKGAVDVAPTDRGVELDFSGLGAGSLPAVDGSDDGSVLKVVGGVWAVAPADAYDITAFTAPAPVEVGATVASPAFTAAHNHPPTALVLTNNDNSESRNVVGTPHSFLSLQSYTKTANNATVTFTLTGSDGISGDTRTASIAWRPRVYWGIGAAGGNSEAFIEALASSALQSSRSGTHNANATGSNRIYWAAPASYGTPTFTVGGFSGGFSLVSNTISVTNAHGVTQNYQLWVSDVGGLGDTDFTVS